MPARQNHIADNESPVRLAWNVQTLNYIQVFIGQVKINISSIIYAVVSLNIFRCLANVG